jgi:tRNA A22 N-methylase
MNEKQLIEKLIKILSVSKNVKLERIQRALELDPNTFDQKIFEWAEKFGFEIDREFINISKVKINDFIIIWKSNLNRELLLNQKIERKLKKKLLCL